MAQASTPAWKITGDYMEACNCDGACPCLYLSDPTTGACDVSIVWHIEQGNFGNTSLDGLNVAMFAHAPANMTQGNWEAALYLDERADEAQAEALGAIFSGQAGGTPAALAPLIGTILGVKRVPIAFTAEGKRRGARVGEAITAEIEAIAGFQGDEATIRNNPLGVAVPEPMVVARSTRYTFNDYNRSWEIAGKTGGYSRFAYQP